MNKTRRQIIEEQDGGDPNECWIWTLLDGKGYGKLNVGGRRVAAHRYSYEVAHGPIPEGMDINHICGTIACWNPAHLEAVSRSRNLHYRTKVVNKTTGYPNVYPQSTGSTFFVRIMKEGKTHHRCGFRTPYEAYLASLELRKELGLPDPFEILPPK